MYKLPLIKKTEGYIGEMYKLPLTKKTEGYIGEGNGKPLQCSCLENLRDGVAQLDTTEVI